MIPLNTVRVIYGDPYSTNMRFGVISDIHANQVALESVLDDMPNDLDGIVCCGDIVGYGPKPRECVEIVKDVCDVYVQGNHDRDLEQPDRYIQGSSVHKGLMHARDELTEEQIDWVINLDKKDEYDGFMVCHSHPSNEDKYVYPHDFKSVKKHIDEEDGLFLGHTHHQHAEFVDGKLILNPGSVGQPRDKNNDSAYAIVDSENNNYELRRVSYDIDKVRDQINNVDLPSKSADRLYKGK